MTKGINGKCTPLLVFIEKATQKHGTFYDYSLVHYKTLKDKVVIKCPIHGNFEQTPKLHFKQGCKQCGIELRASKRRLTRKEFIEKASNTHNNLYDYSLVDYKNSNCKVRILCPLHGEFSQNANAHIRGQGCPDCGSIATAKKKAHTKEQFISNAKAVHGDIYDYSNVDYINNSTIVEIICKQHGSFTQTPNSHLAQKANCPTCSSSSQNIWSYSMWSKAGKSSPNFENYTFYVIRCWNEIESFYKCGKTFTSLSKRFKSKVTMPYNWEIVEKIQGSAHFISTLENAIKSKASSYKYTPLLQFAGQTECFYMNPYCHIPNKP